MSKNHWHSPERQKEQIADVDLMGDIFISYAAANRELAERIHQALEDAGHIVWIDSDNIRYADNWKDAVLPSIERASAILFIVSQSSVVSMNCLDELGYALMLGKRIIPIIAEKVEKFPEALKERVRRDFRDPQSFHGELLRLIGDVTSDPEYVRLHTEISFRAARWQADETGLLDSKELKEVDEWMGWARSHPHLEPHPSELIIQFIHTSKSAIKRSRAKIAGSFITLILLAVVYFGVQWWLGIPRSGINVHVKDGDRVAQQRTVEGVASLRAYLDATIPEKSDRQRLLIATWNLRAFGSGRPEEALHYIAEIISHFDIVALQEVKGASADYDRIREILGTKWLSVSSDVSDGTGGNNERLVFLYDSRKVKTQGLIGELVLTGDLGETGQPLRTPYFVGFSFANTDLVFCNVHIRYGEDPKARVLEAEDIVSQLAKKVKSGRDFPPNLVLIGDVQGDAPGMLEMIEQAGFLLPPAIRDLPTSTNNKPFDQIALMLNPPLAIEPDTMGVVDYYQYVFREDQFEVYASQIESYSNSRRIYIMSDHLPKWVSITSDKAQR